MSNTTDVKGRNMSSPSISSHSSLAWSRELGAGNAGEPAREALRFIDSHNTTTLHGLHLDQQRDQGKVEDGRKGSDTIEPPKTESLAASSAVVTSSSAVPSWASLDLSCSKLAWLPRERYAGFTAVTELALNNNRISRLPPDLFALLPHVRLARFDFNDLSELPCEIGRWEQLEVLVANNNKLKKLPPQMGQLKRLRHVNLHCNQLTTLPITLLELDIRVITLHTNPALSETLKRVCHTVFSLREDSLDLSHCGPFRDHVEEESLSFATLIRELKMEGNSLHSLPSAVGKFFRLETLLVDRNQISAIPAHLCRLPALTMLGIADNKLATLPTEIGLLSSLRSINLDDNFLSTLPSAFFNLINLEELSIANNKLEGVSGDVGRLKRLLRLNVANNKIRTLPTELFTLTQLQTLHMEHNSISVLPDGFTNLQQLREVNLQDNLLTRTPVQLYQLPNIRRLSFENNPIQAPTPPLPSNALVSDEESPTPAPQRALHSAKNTSGSLYLYSFSNSSAGRRGPDSGDGDSVPQQITHKPHDRQHQLLERDKAERRRNVSSPPDLEKREAAPTTSGLTSNITDQPSDYFAMAFNGDYSSSKRRSAGFLQGVTTGQPSDTSDLSLSGSISLASARQVETPKVKKKSKKGSPEGKSEKKKKKKTKSKKEKSGKDGSTATEPDGQKVKKDKKDKTKRDDKKSQHTSKEDLVPIKDNGDGETLKKQKKPKKPHISSLPITTEVGSNGLKNEQSSKSAREIRSTKFAISPKTNGFVELIDSPQVRDSIDLLASPKSSPGSLVPSLSSETSPLGARSNSISKAFQNISPSQKEQILQYQKQRKESRTLERKGSITKAFSIKKKGPKETPEQQVINPLYLLFAPVSPTTNTSSASPSASLAPSAVATPSSATPASPIPQESPVSARRYGTLSSRTLSTQDRVASSFGLKRKVTKEKDKEKDKEKEASETIVINPLLRLRSNTGNRTPGSTKFEPTTGPLMGTSVQFTLEAGGNAKDGFSSAAIEAPSAISRRTSGTAGTMGSPGTLFKTKTQEASRIPTAVDIKPLKKTVSSPDINTRDRTDTISRHTEAIMVFTSSSDDPSSSVDGDNAESSDSYEDDEVLNIDTSLEVDATESVMGRQVVTSNEAWATTSEEDHRIGQKRSKPITNDVGGDRKNSFSKTMHRGGSGRTVPALNLSPVHRRKIEQFNDNIATADAYHSSSGFPRPLNSSAPESVSSSRPRRRTQTERRAKIAHFFGGFPDDNDSSEECYSDSGIGDDSKGRLRSKMNTSFDGQISERPSREEGRSSGLRHSTKEKRATTLLQPGVKNKRRLSIPALSPDDSISPGEFLETLSSIQHNCNKRALKVKDGSIVYDDKTAQDLFKWQEKNSEQLLSSNDRHQTKMFDRGILRERKNTAPTRLSSERDKEKDKDSQIEMRMRKPSFFDDIPEDYEMQFVQTEDGSLKPKRGTLANLVSLLAHERGRDVEYEADFLYTFRDFTSPETLLESLTQRFNSYGPLTHPSTYIDVRKRVLYVLRRWMDLHHYDFAENHNALLHSLMEWMDSVSTQGVEVPFRKFREWVEQKFVRNDGAFTLEERRMTDERPPVPYLPINVTSSSLYLLDLHPEEVARQMTLIESELFRKIKPHEWLNQSWTRPDKKKRAPGIMNMIHRFNDISGWLATEIVSAETVEHRVVLVNRFLIIAQKCLELKNFNAVMEILSGLESSPVQRLKQTWRNLPRKAWDMFEELSDLMSIPQNFKKFRQRLNNLTPPCVPYIGVFLKDLIFIEQGGKEPDGRIINFEKRMMVAKIVRQIVSFQPYVYNLIPVEFIQEFLLNMKPLDEDDLYYRSVQLEGIGAPATTTKKRNKSSMFYFPLGSPRRHSSSAKDYSSPDETSS